MSDAQRRRALLMTNGAFAGLTLLVLIGLVGFMIAWVGWLVVLCTICLLTIFIGGGMWIAVWLGEQDGG